MSAPLGGLAKLPVRAVVLLAVLIVVAASVFLTLYVATPVAHRPDVWHALGLVLGGVGVTLPSVISWLRTEAVHNTQRQTETKIDTITSQTNGALDARIHMGVMAALTAYGAQAAPSAVVVPQQVIPVQGSVVIPPHPITPPAEGAHQ